MMIFHRTIKLILLIHQFYCPTSKVSRSIEGSSKKTSIRVGDQIHFRLEFADVGFMRGRKRFMFGKGKNLDDRLIIPDHEGGRVPLNRKEAVAFAALFARILGFSIKIIKEDERNLVLEFR
jgi:hypothetical protein